MGLFLDNVGWGRVLFSPTVGTKMRCSRAGRLIFSGRYSYAQRAGIVASCHRLRHTFASNLLEQGAELVSIRELLGHASIASSERYAKVSNQKVKQVYVKTMRKVIQQSPV
jgi:site-specific recombinase XerD